MPADELCPRGPVAAHCRHSSPSSHLVRHCRLSPSASPPPDLTTVALEVASSGSRALLEAASRGETRP
jgi:hypothetical protein